MRPTIRLGRIFGVQIGIHYSWFIIALLITLSLSEHFRSANSAWSSEVVWVMALITAILFFGAIIAHELSHSVIAKSRGLPVRSITLFALGGVAQIEREAADPKTEFWMGIAGPIASIVIGLSCLGLALTLGWTPLQTPKNPVLAVLVWLGYINILLALFNMIPGFPLDGGRVLRAILWWVSQDADRSTRAAARIGQLVALSFVVLGVFRFFGGAGFNGLWIAFIGWFLLDAARASYSQVEIMASLRGIRASDVMRRDCPIIDGHLTLQALADEYLLRTGGRCFIVAKDGRIAGLITLHEIKEIPRERWLSTTVDQAMRAIDELRTITPSTPVIDALQIMTREDVNQVPVVSNGQLEGILSRANILQLIQARAELNA